MHTSSAAIPSGRRERPDSTSSEEAERPALANGILCAIDFSSYSKKALRFAAKMAEQLDVELTVVHVVHDPIDDPGFYRRGQKGTGLVPLEDRASEMMQDFLADATEDESPAIEAARVEVIHGIPVTRILELEKKLEPTLLVLGSRGRTGLKRFFLGSTAEEVARHCRGPVLIVKD